MTSAVLFDIGGVLAQDVWEHLYLDPERGLLARFCLDAEELKRVGRQLWDAYAYTPETATRSADDLEKSYWSQFIERFSNRLPKSVSVADFVALSNEFVKVVPGTIRLLDALSAAGVRLAVCSNNTEFWYRKWVEHLDFSKFFDVRNVILSSRVGFPKSSPGFEMFRAAVTALGVEREECLLVDDRIDNVARAQEFGMAAFLFADAKGLEQELQRRGLL